MYPSESKYLSTPLISTWYILSLISTLGDPIQSTVKIPNKQQHTNTVDYYGSKSPRYYNYESIEKWLKNCELINFNEEICERQDEILNKKTPRSKTNYKEFEYSILSPWIENYSNIGLVLNPDKSELKANKDKDEEDDESREEMKNKLKENKIYKKVFQERIQNNRLIQNIIKSIKEDSKPKKADSPSKDVEKIQNKTKTEFNETEPKNQIYEHKKLKDYLKNRPKRSLTKTEEFDLRYGRSTDEICVLSQRTNTYMFKKIGKKSYPFMVPPETQEAINPPNVSRNSEWEQITKKTGAMLNPDLLLKTSKKSIKWWPLYNGKGRFHISKTPSIDSTKNSKTFLDDVVSSILGTLPKDSEYFFNDKLLPLFSPLVENEIKGEIEQKDVKATEQEASKSKNIKAENEYANSSDSSAEIAAHAKLENLNELICKGSEKKHYSKVKRDIFEKFFNEKIPEEEKKGMLEALSDQEQVLLSRFLREEIKLVKERYLMSKRMIPDLKKNLLKF